MTEHASSRKGLIAIVVILSILLAILVAGGGVFIWMQLNLNKISGALDKTQHQLSEQKKQQLSSKATKALPKSEVPDKRQLVTYDKNTGYGLANLNKCGNEFNSDSATSSVHFSSTALGIEWDLPWNKDWGTAECRVKPFEEVGDSVMFGPLVAGEGGLARKYIINKVAPRTAEQTVKQVKAEQGDFLSREPIVEKLNGQEVEVKYAVSGLCNFPSIELIGPENNYVFHAGCSQNLDQTFSELDQLLENLVFVSMVE